MADDTLPMPEGGPTTSAIVASTFRLTNLTAEEQSRLDNLVESVNAWVRDLPVAHKAKGATVWPANIVEGSTMLAGRLWQRRDTPGGVFAVTGGTVPIFVHRQDPDVALLLHLGDYSKPSVG